MSAKVSQIFADSGVAVQAGERAIILDIDFRVTKYTLTDNSDIDFHIQNPANDGSAQAADDGGAKRAAHGMVPSIDVATVNTVECGGGYQLF